MSDRSQSQPQAVQAPPAGSTPQPWAVEAYADKLMDEVFEDIDRGLDLAETPLDTPVEQYQPVSLQPIQIPPIVMQPIISTPDTSIQTIDVDKPKRDRALVWFDRFLIALFATSALAALLLWLMKPGDLPPWMQATTPAPEATAEVEPIELSPEALRNQEFSQYITQSLDRIEGRIPGEEDDSVIGDALPKVASGSTATLSIPVDPASSETMLRSLNRIASALERVSARPAPLPITGNAASSNSTASSSNSTASAARPNTNPSANSRSNPAPSTADRLPSVRVPAPVVAPPPPAPPTEYSDSGNYAPEPTVEAKQPAAPADSYALVGTLDRGNGGRPAALFEVNGSASWVNVGETIGDSDWVVLDVTEDRATIERNGETQSLSVGQQF
mgnify:CR=1 FL=1